MNGTQFKAKLLHRKRIDKMLERILDVPLFLLLASMGYGKTTAVKDFLNSQKKLSYAWFSLSSWEDDELWMWQKFCQSLREVNAELAKRFAEYGLPQTTADMERILDILKNAFTERLIIVIDDYHENKSRLMDRLLTFIARSATAHLHIVVISRSRPKLPVEELALKGLCIELSQSSFEFNREETGELFAKNGFLLAPDELNQLHKNTDGWAAAIYLALLQYAEDPKIEAMRDIARLIKTAVYDKFDKETQEILLKLSLLDRFSLDGAIFVTDNKKAGRLILKMAENHCFIRYDNNNGVYSIHALLKVMLQELFIVSELDKSALLTRCGDWCVRRLNYIEGVAFYHEAENYEKILDIFELHGSTEYFDLAPQIVIRAFTDIPKNLKFSRPVAYLTYIYCYLVSIDAQEGAQLLYEAKACYEAEEKLINKEQILAEIALVESFLQFNDAARMSEYHKKAYILFGGASSRISSAAAVFTFGAPHTLYLYHKVQGSLLALVETIEKNTDYYTQVANGCGTGFEYTARAEYYLETGDLDKAKLFASKAVFKAKNKNQLSLVICGTLCLARIAVLEGSAKEAFALIDTLSKEVAKAGNPMLLNSFDIATGVIYGNLGKLERIPQWLQDGNLSYCNLFYQGMGINYIVIGRVALLRQSYAELEIIVETMREIYRPNNHLFGFIYAGIYDSVAQNHLYGLEKAGESLLPVIKLAQADGIITPFAENLPELGPVLREIQKTQECEWLSRVFGLGERFVQEYVRMNNQKEIKSLTQREIDVLILLSEGCKQKDIAAKLCLSQNTIRRHLQNAYKKLGVSNKILAVKKAKELNMMS